MLHFNILKPKIFQQQLNNSFINNSFINNSFINNSFINNSLKVIKRVVKESLKRVSTTRKMSLIFSKKNMVVVAGGVAGFASHFASAPVAMEQLLQVDALRVKRRMDRLNQLNQHFPGNHLREKQKQKQEQQESLEKQEQRLNTQLTSLVKQGQPKPPKPAKQPAKPAKQQQESQESSESAEEQMMQMSLMGKNEVQPGIQFKSEEQMILMSKDEVQPRPRVQFKSRAAQNLAGTTLQNVKKVEVKYILLENPQEEDAGGCSLNG
jgi:Mg-chelatase subunit ChlI